MSGFNELELAALSAIFDETPEFASGLNGQLARSVVVKRDNSGAGFFTHIECPDDVPSLNCTRVLGTQTYARLKNLTYGLGFVLFMRDGKLHVLEGFTCGNETTSAIDFDRLCFEIRPTPFDQ